MENYNLKEKGFRPVYKGVPPFMKFKDGYGYYGVLLESEKTGELQCHLCGSLANNIAKHIYHKHKNISVKQYKEKVGLNLRTPLMSETTRKKIKNNFLNLTEQKRKEIVKRLKNLNKNNHRDGKIKPRGKYSSQEFQNKFGTCQEQAKTKFWEEYKKWGRIPTVAEMSGSLRSVVFTRFSSYKEALLSWGITDAQYREHILSGRINAVEVRKQNDYFPKYSKEVVRQQYGDFFFKNKRLPTWGEVKHYGLPGRAVFLRVFGTTKSKVENGFRVKVKSH